MALPPKGDPRRPLHLAIRSTRVLGIVCVLIGSCAILPLTMARLLRGRGIFAPAWTVVFGAIFYMAPGTLLLVFSVFMGRRRFWAVVGALVVSSLGALFLVVVGVGIGATFYAAEQVSPAPVIVATAVWAVFFLAFAQLIYHLARSFEGIKHPPFGQEIRGFELLPAATVRPVIIGPEAFAPAPPQPSPDPVDGIDTTHDPAAPR